MMVTLFLLFVFEVAYPVSCNFLALTCLWVPDWPSANIVSFYQAIYVFGFDVPLFNRHVVSTHMIKWDLLIIHKLLLAAAYGFILFVHFSKWKEKLPREYILFLPSSVF